MKAFISAVALLGALVPAATAADWIFLSRSAGANTAVYIDAGSVGSRGGLPTAWIKMEILKTHNILHQGEKYMSLIQVSADGAQYRYLAMSDYDADGELVQANHVPTEWMNLVPDSLMDAAVDWLKTHPRRPARLVAPPVGASLQDKGLPKRSASDKACRSFAPDKG